MSASDKIEFTYLNRNLMVSTFRPPTLAFDGNRRRRGSDANNIVRENKNG
jgi:hypothetical protein